MVNQKKRKSLFNGRLHSSISLCSPLFTLVRAIGWRDEQSIRVNSLFLFWCLWCSLLFLLLWFLFVFYSSVVWPLCKRGYCWCIHVAHIPWISAFQSQSKWISSNNTQCTHSLLWISFFSSSLSLSIFFLGFLFLLPFSFLKFHVFGMSLPSFHHPATFDWAHQSCSCFSFKFHINSNNANP